MKITQEYRNDKDTDILEIISAEYLGEFVVNISFSDAQSRIIDFRPFLEKSLHPSVSKYLNEALFAKFSIVNGNLNWNDYDLIFPLDNLYAGKIS